MQLEIHLKRMFYKRLCPLVNGQWQYTGAIFDSWDEINIYRKKIIPRLISMLLLSTMELLTQQPATLQQYHQIPGRKLESKENTITIVKQ